MTEAFMKALTNDVFYFFNNPVNLNQQDERGQSLLHYAVRTSSVQVISYLLDNDIDVNLVDSNGESALFDCAKKGKMTIAKQLYEEYRFYDRNVLFFPAKDLIFFQADIHGNQLTRERVKCFKRILSGKPVTVITTLDSFMTPQIPLDYMKENVIHIAVHDSLDERQIAGKLVTLGYEKTYQVEEPGQFSIRGGILDVYDLTEENPYRIELWGDEVDSIRSFDVLSQRSVEKLQSIDIYPASEMILDEERLQRGLTLLEEDARGCSEELRKAFKTEEAYRVKSQVKALKERMRYLIR